MTRRGWSTIDFLTKTWPDEYCDVAGEGQGMSDRVFMLQQAARIVRSPRLSREDRRRVEERSLVEAKPHLRVAR